MTAWAAKDGRISSDVADASGKTPLPPVLRNIWLRSVAAFVGMLLLATLEGRAGNPGERFGPLVDPLFGDLLEYVPTFKAVHTSAFFLDAALPRVAYPPVGTALFVPLYVSGHPVVVYLLVAALWLAVCVLGVRRTLLEAGCSQRVGALFPLTMALVCFPWLVFCSGGTLSCLRGCWRRVGVGRFCGGGIDGLGCCGGWRER